jgi:hypothetical protein
MCRSGGKLCCCRVEHAIQRPVIDTGARSGETFRSNGCGRAHEIGECLKLGGDLVCSRWHTGLVPILEKATPSVWRYLSPQDYVTHALEEERAELAAHLIEDLDTIK